MQSRSPVEIVRESRKAAITFAESAGKRRVIELHKRSEADLQRRIRERFDLRVDTGPARESFRTMQLRVSLLQFKDAVRMLEQGLTDIVGGPVDAIPRGPRRTAAQQPCGVRSVTTASPHSPQSPAWLHIRPRRASRTQQQQPHPPVVSFAAMESSQVRVSPLLAALSPSQSGPGQYNSS